MDHRDPSDVAFTPGFTEPLMMTTDGGVHLTKDKGKNWTLTGSNAGGFAALQVGEMTGRQVGGSSPHLDLYYGTQDNDIKGSSDGGATWNGSLCCEGAFLQVDRDESRDGGWQGDGPEVWQAARCLTCSRILVKATPDCSAVRRAAAPIVPTHTRRSSSSATTSCSRSSCRRTPNTG